MDLFQRPRGVGGHKEKMNRGREENKWLDSEGGGAGRWALNSKVSPQSTPKRRALVAKILRESAWPRMRLQHNGSSVKSRGGKAAFSTQQSLNQRQRTAMGPGASRNKGSKRTSEVSLLSCTSYEGFLPDCLSLYLCLEMSPAGQRK
jgi:hypothetical protein